MKKAICIGGLLTLFYVLGYSWFRHTHVEVWEYNGRSYVIFPQVKGTYSECAERADRTVTVKIRKGKA